MRIRPPTSARVGWHPAREPADDVPKVSILEVITDRKLVHPGAQPERRLMLAVLEDAILTYLRLAGCTEGLERRRFEEVEQWIQASDTTWLYSFERICESIGFEPDAVREALRRAPDRRGQPDLGRSRRISGARHAIGAA